MSPKGPDAKGASPGASGARGSRVIRDARPGLTVERYFTREGVDPFAEVEWELRDAVISGADGKVFFEQRQVEFPRAWSQTATNVVVQKYFRGTLGTPQRERSVKQMIGRVADTIYGWGKADGYFKTARDAHAFRDELVHLLVQQKMAFNSPVWFNVGVEAEPQCSACFINSVDDSMASILTLAKTEGMLFKYGSGAGSNLSKLRSSHENLNGGGTASGPVSFMRGFDSFAGAIKSGGKTRRAAKMVILNADHPDVVDFIDCKALEEKKAWALIDAGYDGGFNVVGGAYDSVGYQNANHSVRVTDDFMQAVLKDGEWSTRAVLDGRVVDTFKARDVMRKMADAAWICGDPGIQFDTTINDWHPCINTDRINASNPCSEYMFLDDSACNLASLNLRKFQKQHGPDAGELDIEAYRRAVQVTITAMEIIVDNSRYPTEKIAQNSYDYRPLGLGFANLGALLMSRGLPYDSVPGRAYAAALTAIMCGEAYRMSAQISADATGPFKGYARNEQPFMRVIRKHRAAVEQIDATVPYDLKQAARNVWDEAITLGDRYGFRNGQVTVLAPTGTIAFLMDCDTTGVEPDIALVKYKRLVGGGLLKIVNQTVPEALRKLGYDEREVEAIVAHIDAHDTIEGAPGLEDEHLPVFDCAFRSASGTRSIHYMGHIRMMSATQPFLSGAISKTVNLPTDCTVEDIEDAYLQAWKLGLKAIAVYRDGCKRTQPLSTNLKQATTNGRAAVEVEAPADPLDVLSTDERVLIEALRARKSRPAGPPMAVRHKLADERASFTHKFSIGGHEGYVTVGLYEDGTPGEIFVRMAKEGSVIAGLMDSFATAVSLALQHGVPLQILVDKFKGTRFEPSGFTGNQEIPIATSIMDYLFRWLAIRFPTDGTIVERHPAARLAQLDLPKVPLLAKDFVDQAARDAEAAISVEVKDRAWVQETDAPPCHECGTLMVRNGACHKCPNCGSTSGCS
ncbi:MAG: vitamin B12-dependent ribonucleotide reductase [Kofleriaceae bacterium]|nr:vitamin B12-dependent ribonucleotide reductase [Kofleriaceae bacterium]MCL4223097.1 vitamin B12-dependent ribonucleotide reductase [Myxococcales bacterium]